MSNDLATENQKLKSKLVFQEKVTQELQDLKFFEGEQGSLSLVQEINELKNGTYCKQRPLLREILQS